MIVSFCSSRNGQGFTTTNMLSAAIVTVFSKKLKVLVTDVDFKQNDLGKYIFGNTKDVASVEFGFKPLMRLAKNNLLDANRFSDYTIPILKNSRFDFLSSKFLDDEVENLSNQNNLNYFMKIIYEAKELYDVIFIDLSSKSEISEIIIKNSDLIVVNVNQNMRVIEDYLSMNIDEMNDNIMINVSNYNGFNKLNLNKIKKMVGKKQVNRISYDAQIVDVMNSSSIVEYIGRNIIEKGTKNNLFFTDLNKMVDKIFSEK